MIILRPNGRRRLDEQILEAMSDDDGVQRRYLLCLCAGAVDPENLEPFATLDRVLQDTVDRELRLVVTDGWPERFWTTEVAGALEAADVNGTFELAPSRDQQQRALQQRVSDGRVEVLFLERGRVRGSALTIVAPRRDDSRPLPLNVKMACLELLQAARDALIWRPRPMQDIVRDAREALGIPAGPVTSIAAVRRSRGEIVAGAEAGAVTIDRVAELLQSPPPPPPPASPGVSFARPAPSPAPVAPAPRAAPSASPAPKKASPAERHALADGRCTVCGKSGARLEEPCGKQELGRIGFLELD